MKKRGLVMSGGAARGAFTQGCLVELARTGHEYEFISGVSVGALEAGMISQYPIGKIQDAVDILDDIWLGIRGDKDIYKKWFLGILSGLIARDGFTNSAPLQKIIKNRISDKAAQASGRQIRIGCCSYGKGHYWEADENTLDLYKWVTASSAYSPFLLPIRINDDIWFDGGYRCVTPLRSAIDAGCDEIDVIITSKPQTKEKDPHDNWAGTKINAYHIGMRVVDLMANEVFYRDAKYAETINDLVDSGHPKYKDKKKLKVRIFMPDENLPGSSLSFDPALIRQRRDQGIRIAEQVVNNCSK
jgi:NTE family protein